MHDPAGAHSASDGISNRLAPRAPATASGPAGSSAIKTSGTNRLAGNIRDQELPIMATMPNPTRADFEALLNEQLGGAEDGGFEGRVVKGTVTAIENGFAMIDVGLKSEGRIPLKEFARSEGDRSEEHTSE